MLGLDPLIYIVMRQCVVIGKRRSWCSINGNIPEGRFHNDSVDPLRREGPI